MKKDEIVYILQKLDKLPMPDKENLLSAVSETVNETDIAHTAKTKKKHFIYKPLLAAVMSLILVFGVFGYSFSVEAKVYNDAIIFFTQNNLSTEGLTKNEVKKVYRDITTESFSYPKTSEVLEKSIGGYEIFQSDPTPEELRNIWNYKNEYGHYSYINMTSDDEVSYNYDEEYDDNANFVKCIFSKQINGAIEWEVEFYSFFITDYVEYDDKVFVCGNNPVSSSAEKRSAYLALIENGEIIWQRFLDNGFKNESIDAILPTDSEIAVFSRGDLNYVCLNIFDYNGDKRGFTKNKVGNYGIWNAARLGDGYIVQLGSYMTGEYSRIVKVDSDGYITDSINYLSDDTLYYITDMIEYSEKVYLSGYSVPIDENSDISESRYDIQSILNYIFGNELYNISNEDLTKLVREQFTAVLLICSPDSGEPNEFFTVNGSVGNKLSNDENGKLIWQVESISDTELSLTTSAFTIGGASYVYLYSFDENGALLKAEKTGEVVSFAR